MFRDHLQLPRQIHLLCLGAFVNRAGSFVMIFLTIYVTESLEYSVSFATRCIGMFGLGSIIAAPLGGQLADQFGRKFTMLLALFGGAAALLALSVAKSQAAFLLGFGVFALLAEMYRPAASAMIADLTSPEQRSHAFGLLYISINLGFACALPIGGFLAERSYSLLFWGDAVTTSLFGLLIVFCIRETLHAQAGAADRPEQRSAGEMSIGSAARQILRDRVFLSFCLATLLSALVFMQGMSTLPIVIRQSGFSNMQFGGLMAINGLLIVLLQLPATRWLGRFDPVRVIACGTLLVALGFGLTSQADSVAWFAVTIVIWTMGEIMQAPFINAVVTHLAPPNMRARYLGVFSMSFAVSMTVGAPAGGEIMSRFGAEWLWMTCFVVAAGASVIFALLSGQIARRRKSQDEQSSEVCLASKAPPRESPEVVSSTM